MRVLLVDDDLMNRRCLQELIAWEQIGCEMPVCAADGAQALALIEEQPPDIVITDIKMPVMDGKELCQKIHEKYPEISVFFVSAYGDFETAQLAIRCNVKGYVLKPLDRAVLDSLQEMVMEAVNDKEYVSFCRKITSGEYQTVMQTAIEEKDSEVIEKFFEKLSKIPEHFLEKEISIWKNLLSPITLFKATYLKMEYGLLIQSEQRLLDELLSKSIGERSTLIYGLYRELLQDSVQTKNVVWEIQESIKKEFSSPDLDISVLAQRFNFSPVYLGRIFFEQTGMKLSDYISDKRLEFACEKLRNSRKSAREISYLAGYRDPSYFNKVFHRKMGMTPKSYREKYRTFRE